MGLGQRGFNHHAVKHSRHEYVDGNAHTNGIESFWALLKRGLYGTYHSVSKKHLQRYVNEFCFKANNNTAISFVDAVCSRANGNMVQFNQLTA